MEWTTLVRLPANGTGQRTPATTASPRARDRPEARSTSHLARCRAVVFPPFNEDYGFVTVEAFMCGKPVITCADSGGPSELVRNGQNGYVTEPTPEAFAAAMRNLTDDRNLAARMGEEGHRMASAMTWSDAVRQLLA